MNQTTEQTTAQPVTPENKDVMVIDGKVHITIKEAVRRNYCSDSTLRLKMKTGEINGSRGLDGKYWIPETEFAKYMRRRPAHRNPSAA